MNVCCVPLKGMGFCCMKADRDDLYYIAVILKHCTRIQELTKRFNGSLQMLIDDYAYEQSVVLSFIQIGEAAKGLSKEFVSKYSQVDWSAVCKFRDKITHHYDEIEEDIVWDSIEKDIPLLKSFCEKITDEKLGRMRLF